jgi:hypothetical protein
MVNFELIKKLNKEKEELMNRNPELRLYQNYINKQLDKCGKNKHNRMTILSTLMKEKVKELQNIIKTIRTRKN